MIKVNNLNRQNKYLAVAEDIAGRIEKGLMPERLPTVEELAKEYGITLMTMQKALDILKERGMVQAFPGQGIFLTRLKRVKTNILALVIHTCPDKSTKDDMPLTRKLAQGIRMAAAKHGLGTIILEHNDNPEIQLQGIKDIVKNNRADGIILWQTEEKSRSKSTDYLQENDFPFVLIPELDFALHHDCNTVTNSDTNAAAEIMTHLLGSGYRKIAFSAQSRHKNTTHFQHRYEQYSRSLEISGLKPMNPFFIDGGEKYLEEVSRIITESGGIDAIFCESDDAAGIILSAFLKLGIKVPDDIAMASYDNTGFAERILLSSVDQHFDKIGIRAVEILMEEIDGKHDNPVHEVVSSELIIRNSSRN